MADDVGGGIGSIVLTQILQLRLHMPTDIMLYVITVSMLSVMVTLGINALYTWQHMHLQSRCPERLLALPVIFLKSVLVRRVVGMAGLFTFGLSQNFLSPQVGITWVSWPLFIGISFAIDHWLLQRTHLIGTVALGAIGLIFIHL